MAYWLHIKEITSPCMNLRYHHFPADYQGRTVQEILDEWGVRWEEDNGKGDIYVFKANVVSNKFPFGYLRSLKYYLERRLKTPNLLLIGEPRHKSAPYYRSADPKRTLAVAPGKEFKRLYLPQIWKEPHIETWEKRLDKFVWFGAPYPDRVRLAKKLISWGIELDIYSSDRWPLPNYRGPSEYEYETSLKYKYRLAVENTMEFGYFSEKLFQSQRAGCLTFYLGDTNNDLKQAEGTFLRLTKENVQNREKLANDVLSEMDKYLHSTRWEWCSFKKLFEDVIDLAQQFVPKKRRSPKEREGNKS